MSSTSATSITSSFSTFILTLIGVSLSSRKKRGGIGINLGVGIAPWNMHRYEYKNHSFTYLGKEYPFVFFHFHGVKVEIINNILHISSLHHELNTTLIEKFYQPYAELLKEVLTKYLGYKLDNAVVHDMPFVKKIDYRIRSKVRGNAFVRWIWFSLLRKKDQGHGSKY